MTPKSAPSSRDEIVTALFGLFRRGGYDVVSLSDISAATGLGKSSLYHYFPGGKPDMAEAVANHRLATMREKLFAPLAAEIPLPAKIAPMTRSVDSLYAGGDAPCHVANMLPSGVGSSPLKAIIVEWIEALSEALKQAGIKISAARVLATDAVVRIEGALVVAKATGDKRVFASALRDIGADLAGR
ncbi:MAG: TetR/AcrR family transcriptional regulator [Parvularculaceae bacterium]|nr:TetR/AcrR family transcriptional regulator [Parvularculaceae bacterium]